MTPLTARPDAVAGGVILAGADHAHMKAVCRTCGDRMCKTSPPAHRSAGTQPHHDAARVLDGVERRDCNRSRRRTSRARSSALETGQLGISGTGRGEPCGPRSRANRQPRTEASRLRPGCAQNHQFRVRPKERPPGSTVRQNGGSVRVIPAFPVAQRHAVDRRNLEADLLPVRCDWSAGGLRGSLAEVLRRGGTPAAARPQCHCRY